MSRKKVLLTGATGFLGSHLLRSMIDHDKYDVVVLKRSFSNLFRIQDLLTGRVVVYDSDRKELDAVFQENRFDCIVHTATNYGRAGTPTSAILDSNLIFPIKILELAIKHGTGCFINTDSYFNKEHLSYTHLLDYSLSKKSFNTWLKYFSKKIKVANIMLEHIYGEQDGPDKFVESMIQNIAVQKVKTVNLTYGNQKRDFIYVGDAVEAYMKVMENVSNINFSYKTYELGTGKSIEIKEFVGLIKDLSRSNTNLNFGTIPYRPDEIMDSKGDISELENLGWHPRFSPREGLCNILKKYGIKDL